MRTPPPRRRVVGSFALCALLAGLHVAHADSQGAQGVAHAAPQPAEDLGAGILRGVHRVATPGVPGSVVVWGDDAAALVVGGKGTAKEAVVACAQLGTGAVRGRIVAFGHGGYFDDGALRDGDTRTLLKNAALWAANRPAPQGVPQREDNAAQAAPRPVAVCVGAPAKGGIADVLEGAGFEVVRGSAKDLANLLAGGANPGKPPTLLVLANDALNDAAQQAVLTFLNQGGGLLTAQTGWGWRQVHDNADLRTHAINKVLAHAGLAFGDGTPDVPEGGLYVVDDAPLALVNASLALDRAVRAGEQGEKLGKDDAAQVESSVSGLLTVLPRDNAPMRARIEGIVAKHAGDVIPTHDKPVRQSDALSRIVLAWQVMEAFDAAQTPGSSHGSPRALATHAAFPGAVPDDAPRIERTVAINPEVPGWQSTGLYAPAGEAITLSVPTEALQAGLEVRIGAHSDELWNLPQWRRAPRITNTAKLNAEAVSIVNPFGGLVYIVVPDKCAAKSLTVLVRGAVAAPLYVRGKTDVAEWRETIRAAPGPWAELASDKVILTVPSSHVRALENPDELMALWDRVLDAAADLAVIPRERERPQRYVADEQISAGYMHSGYPIMTHLDAADDMATPALLAKGNWGLFHELGHNHQEGEWTFGGTGEVTCNLFSLYIMETVCGKSPQEAHDANDKTQERIRAYFEQPASLGRWQQDPFTALVIYRQLREEFGWEAYKKVFAEYQALSAQDRPKTDDAKRDQWLTRMSRSCGRNLGPLFEAWGITTSASARESIADLPVWMPADFPPKR